MTDLGKIAKAIGEKEAKELSKKTVAIVGLSSVGSQLAETFARLGLTLRLVDMGRIEDSDLTSNALYVKEEITKFKAKEAKKHLEEINPDANVKSFHEELKGPNIFLLKSDLIIDCSQNWNTSKEINDFCKKEKIPLIYARVAGAEGLILSAKSFVHKKVEPHVTKLGTVKEKGLLPSAINMACSIVLSKAFQILKGEKFSNKLYYFDSVKMSKKESKL